MPWVLADSKNSEALGKFLITQEYYAASLTTRLLDKQLGAQLNGQSPRICVPPPNEAVLFIHYHQNTPEKLSSVFYIDRYGFAFIILNSYSAQDPYFKELHRVARPYISKIFSCMGRKQDCEQFIALFGIQPSHFIHYYTMNKIARAPANRTPAKKFTPQNLQIRKASRMDLKKLLPLHLAYQKEEVLLPHTPLNINASTMHFLHILETEQVYFIEMNKQAIAKVQTNAQGARFDQIGGIYTLPQFRKQGLAGILIEHISSKILNSGKFLSLYVKSTNSEAISLYTKIGFRIRANFMVFYL